MDAKQHTPAQRRSLSNRGGEVSEFGNPTWSPQLAAAVREADAAPDQDLTHGFHTYPARMHPRLAREVVKLFTAPGEVVLDPFCGSGTVLVEALVAGCRPQGVDLNPLALRISEAHCGLRDARERERFTLQLRSVARASEERVQTRARAKLVLDRETSGDYDSHVLFELSGLLEEIERVAHQEDRRALMVVFSALLVKFSRRRGDTSSEHIAKRIRKGLATEFFVRKGDELVLRWEALFESAPQDAFAARLMCGDARRLPDLLGPRFGADFVLTSPPYGGTYDYAANHALRNAWFGLDSSHLEDSEVGSRRRLNAGPEPVARWDDELRSVLRSLRKVMRREGRAVLWLGDGELNGRRVPADQQIARLAPQAGFELVAGATQQRHDVRGGPLRGEHLLLLAPTRD
jgi:DNA methylase